MTEAHQQQRYRVIERLASGGMAEVFIAESAGIEGFKKQVAIKRVLPALSEKKRFIAMFLDEARLSAQLSHSNVVQVFDIGVGDNAYFIVMEYVDGADLKGVIEYMRNSGKAFPLEAACFITAKICEGLSYAHELRGHDGQALKIVHRDLSPPNVLITKYGEIKIVDFGLAKATSQLEKSEVGIVKGKFGYLAPEAASGEEVDQRADIFAAGIILWEMLSGRRLFYGETDFATVKQVQEAKIPQLDPPVPAELWGIITRALAREPATRYGTARDLGRDLTRFLYQHGRAVSAYDIAELVRGAVAHRKRQQPDKSSIIDKLIEEALLEFTSLQDDQAPAKPAKPEEPRKPGGFENISSWADELDLAPASAARPDPVRSALPSGAFEAGNLAALEETDPKIPAPAHLRAALKEGTEAPAKAEVVKAPAKAPKPAAEEALAPAPAKKSSGAMVFGILVALIVVAAGVWMAMK
jgi:serine/threonine protein kinase